MYYYLIIRLLGLLCSQSVPDNVVVCATICNSLFVFALYALYDL